MLNRLLSALAISTVAVGCCFAFTEASVPAVQDEPAPAPAVFEPVKVAPQRWSEPSLDRRMQMLERRVRFDMILYTGRFGQHEWPPRQPLAVALTVGAATR
jgi:hypothetical protein